MSDPSNPSASEGGAVHPAHPEILGHPRGLVPLFFTEMWERFSYYGMRALLVLYLTKDLDFKRGDALWLYGAYTGLVYLTPLLGGFLSDRFLGQRKAVLVGGVVMALGHFAMAFESQLYQALALLIIGNGFFKPNITTIVGTLYPEKDPRRDGGYTIFYMGINIGAMIAPLFCGYLGESEYFGFHYGFGAAGIGMVVGLITFMSFQHWIGQSGFPPGRLERVGPKFLVRDWIDVTWISALILALVYGGVEYWDQVRALVWAPAFLESMEPAYVGQSLIYLLRAVLVLIPLVLLELVTRGGSKTKADASATANGEEASATPKTDAFLSTQDWLQMAVIAIVTSFVAIFWMGFEQAGGTLTLFADEYTNRYGLKVSWFQAINPFFIITLAPLFSMLWTGLAKAKIPFPSIMKMGLGIILLGLAYIIMAMAQSQADQVGRVSPLFLTGCYFLSTVGELMVSPVGLSVTNKLAPLRVASLMMAVFLCSSAFGNYMAGALEGLLPIEGKPLSPMTAPEDPGAIAEVAYSPEALQAAALETDGTLLLWDTVDRQVLWSLKLDAELGDAPVLAFSESFDISSDVQESEYGFFQGVGLAFGFIREDEAADQVVNGPIQRIAVGGADGKVRLVDPGEEAEVASTLDLDGGSAIGFAFNSSEAFPRLAVATSDGRVRVYHPGTGAERIVYELPDVQYVAYSRDQDRDKLLLAAADASGTITVWNPDPDEEGVDPSVPLFRIETGQNNLVALTFASGSSLLRTIDAEGAISSYATTALEDGRRDDFDDESVVVEADDLAIASATFSPAEETAALFTDSGRLIVVGTHQGEVIYQAEPVEGDSATLAFSNNGQQLISVPDGQETLTRTKVAPRLWTFLTVVPIGSGVILLILSPLLRKMAGGKDD